VVAIGSYEGPNTQSESVKARATSTLPRYYSFEIEIGDHHLEKKRKDQETGSFEFRFCIFIRVLASHYFWIAYLRPEMKSIATNYMPEVVPDLPYDFKKMLELFPQAAS
jgi:hypothetical protein